MPDYTAPPPTAAERRALATRHALNTWPLLTTSQQNLIRFGIFPAEIMEALETDTGCTTHDLACAFMDVAKAHGGMRA